jgi:OOP family OmpA-OmpF porin
MAVNDTLIDKMEIFVTTKIGEKLSNLIVNTTQANEKEVIAEVITEKNTQITNTTNSKDNQQVEVKLLKDNQSKKETVTANKLPQPTVASTKKELNGKSNGKTIYFDFNELVLTADDEATLDGIISSLRSSTESRVTMIGFTDNIGLKETNVRVASARARASRAYLTKNGISKNRIDIYGYGEVMFKGDNSTEEGRAQNRRVEIQIN